jgi:hypothetical protein
MQNCFSLRDSFEKIVDFLAKIWHRMFKRPIRIVNKVPCSFQMVHRRKLYNSQTCIASYLYLLHFPKNVFSFFLSIVFFRLRTKCLSSNGGDTFHRNVGNLLQDYMASQRRIPQSASSLLSTLQISDDYSCFLKIKIIPQWQFLHRLIQIVCSLMVV